MRLTFGDVEGLAQRKKTRRELFLNDMDPVVPWKRLLALIEPHYPVAGRRGRQPCPLATMLRIHFLQQWYALSDPPMEEALYDTAVMRRFAGINSLERILMRLRSSTSPGCWRRTGWPPRCLRRSTHTCSISA
jgi:transposase, IS5 family